MGLQFTKMHGLGNDFVVIDGINQLVSLNESVIKMWASRHTGIGFDQCLLVEPSQTQGIDFFYRIFNADGHEVGQCGNGARCLARFLEHYDLTDKKTIRVATSTTEMTLELHDDDTVSVSMEKPKFSPSEIPLKADKEQPSYAFETSDGQHLKFHALNVGNPHAVIKVDDVNKVDVEALGKEICEDARFPEQVNVGFMALQAPGTITLRVYERGCGETLACGSGAVAAAVVAVKFYNFKGPVTVSLPGGDLVVSWSDKPEYLALRGPAEFVYEGNLIP